MQIFFSAENMRKHLSTVPNPILFLRILVFKVLNIDTIGFFSSSDLENNCSS